MRFSTLIAFTLPLSALAAPSLVQRDDHIFSGFTTALNETRFSLIQTTARASGLKGLDYTIRKATDAAKDLKLETQLSDLKMALDQQRNLAPDDLSSIAEIIDRSECAIVDINEDFQNKVDKGNKEKFEALIETVKKAIVGFQSVSVIFQQFGQGSIAQVLAKVEKPAGNCLV